MTLHDQMLTVRLIDVPGYLAWSEQHADEEPALIARLDATEVTMGRDHLAELDEDYFESLLADLREDYEE